MKSYPVATPMLSQDILRPSVRVPGDLAFFFLSVMFVVVLPPESSAKEVKSKVALPMVCFFLFLSLKVLA